MKFRGIIDEIGTNRKDMKAGERVVINPLISCGNYFPCKENNPHLCPNLNLVSIRGNKKRQIENIANN